MDVPKRSDLLKLTSAALFFILGRYPVSWLFSSLKRKAKKPEKIQSDEFFWIRCDSGNIVYVEFDGPKSADTIVFLHGLNSNSHQWYYQRRLLNKEYRLVFLDLPGHGRSLKPKDLSIATLANDLYTILKYFNIQNPIIYGHSMGGMATLEYCRKYQKTLHPKAIILQHTTYTSAIKTCQFSLLLQMLKKPVVIPFLHFAKKHNTLFQLLCWFNYLNGLTEVFTRYTFFTGSQTPAQLRFTAAIAAHCPPAVVAEGLLETFRFDMSSDLRRIDVPALIFGAENDRLTLVKASLYLHRKLHRSQLKILPEGHFSMVENFEEVNSTIKNFLTLQKQHFKQNLQESVISPTSSDK